MFAQRLRHVVTIQQPTVSADAYGGGAPSWAAFASNVRASVEPLSGREFVAAHANQAEHLVRIVLRYMPGVTEQMRVIYALKAYAIQAVTDVGERQRILELMCLRGRELDPSEISEFAVTVDGAPVTADGDVVTATP